MMTEGHDKQVQIPGVGYPVTPEEARRAGPPGRLEPAGRVGAATEPEPGRRVRAQRDPLTRAGLLRRQAHHRAARRP